MADFKIFEPILLKQEGGYANKAGDAGGETWMGVARNYYPNWSGWAIIDANKSQLPSNDRTGWGIFSRFLRTLPDLQAHVDVFYKTTFWNAMQGDAIISQSLVNFIGDWGVNAGLTVPVKHAQRLLGILDDGKVGPETIIALNSHANATFFAKLKQERINFYYAVVKAHPEDRQFLGDWLARTNSFTFQN